MGLDCRVQSKKQRLGKSRKLGGIVYVDDEVSAPSTIYVSSSMDLRVSPIVPSLVSAFPFSMGMRNVSIKRMPAVLLSLSRLLANAG